MSGDKADEVIKQLTVKIIETVYVEAGTADEFKSVVQRLTGKDYSLAAAAAAAPEKIDRSSRGDRQEVGSPSNAKQSS